MKHIPSWILGLTVTLALILIPVVLFMPKPATARDNPQAVIQPTAVHVSHADIITGPFDTPQQVTENCLSCHEDAASEFMQTTHWTWESEPQTVSWRDEPVTVGKINQINNFCIGTQGNEKKCMSCHAGYDWQENASYDFSNESNVDCLVCHADRDLYAKGEFGNPAEGVDLLASARSVRNPTRQNCGSCHFDGGGGNGVKHGDLDQSLLFPSDTLDVHMGQANFQCTTCHVTEQHNIKGRLLADNIRIDPAEQVACTDCHSTDLHEDERLNSHTASVACQTCHIPAFAVKDPTKTQWDWSTAGGDQPDEHYTYLKIKGNFVYSEDVLPTYLWANGNIAYRYLLGDKIDPAVPTHINLPAGAIDDPLAKIFPFKIHIGNQPYDTVNNYLLQPITAGTNGFWTNFDWDNAFRLAEPITGLAYSGEYGFAPTLMYWPTTHMVQPASHALSCNDCHSPEGRLDWQALGYPGDPMVWGGRNSPR
ncbi:MAG TPA: tetrathionate reductase family octaheme c-type cytochrome [Anaerolineales bacterium]|nr:tetrathionate reductase family octaheme c-type cytochrome [Anaerolineales bacterium]